ncbi:hypothetical protein HYH02_008352 [Chlamydomonas schloesseri]|uniref:THH1/TOM1/TOM3 domain-containing protein n=1 Tax=Chlamydomonas schloesseri TaxID=2026947 RepID=A0A835WG32_9CHLO|nr:hypothetical protein HYH02_008352 [Chlamydomonas schloesseri]|eukprot:KAG2446792.1 hypothetical protein HYH02_008352 [Chlamydomonas schloesseri]
MVQLAQVIVNGIDWGIIGVASMLVLVSAVGAFLSFRYSSSKRRPVAREFNYLWRARAFTEVLAVGYAASHLLRLQLLWGPASIIVDGGLQPTTLCRVYIAATYGIFEPGFLLLALFACLYSVQGRDSAKNPNFNIVLFAAGFSLPSLAAQLVAALFTRIFELDYDGSHMLGILFSAYNDQLPQHCGLPGPGGAPPLPDSPVAAAPSDCAFCVFPLLSTFISAAFCGVYLLGFLAVTQRIFSSVINKALARRVRVLQVLTVTWIVVSLACRGCTVLFVPFGLGFEILRVAHMLAVVALVMTLEWFLVLKPVWDTHEAERTLKRLEKNGTGLPMPLLGLPNPLYPPTEMHSLQVESTESAARKSAPDADCA